MSESDWERFSALVERYAPMAPTQARAYGLALSDLLNSASVPHPRARAAGLDGLGAS